MNLANLVDRKRFRRGFRTKVASRLPVEAPRGGSVGAFRDQHPSMRRTSRRCSSPGRPRPPRRSRRPVAGGRRGPRSRVAVRPVALMMLRFPAQRQQRVVAERRLPQAAHVGVAIAPFSTRERQLAATQVNTDGSFGCCPRPRAEAWKPRVRVRPAGEVDACRTAANACTKTR